MNIKPPKNTSNRREISPEFQQVLRDKSANFVGRKFVFAAINNFLNQYDRGYFTIVGAPGSGKSAILAKYAIDNPNVVYYNAQLEGKNRPEQFIRSICTQIIETCDTISLYTILQEVSNQLEIGQRFIIIIDALDAIVRTKEILTSNIFNLPRYLPKGIYFLLSRRPFVREKSGLLIETYAEILDLENYPRENRKDMQACIQQHLNQTHSDEKNPFNEPEEKLKFIQQLTAKGENNFMFLSEILNSTSENLSSKKSSLLETLETTPLSPDLEAYYQQHLQQMCSKSSFSPIANDPENSIARAILNILVQQTSAIPASAIANLIDVDEYDVEEVLEDWIEFLRPQWVEGEICYSLYHSHFRKWLYQQINPAT